MGVLYDYFRAPDRDVALRLLDKGDGVPRAPTTVEDLDALDAKGIDPWVVLGQLLASMRGVPWRPDLVDTVLAWPPEEGRPATPEEAAGLPENSPWITGPAVEELADTARDVLAEVDDHRLPFIAEQWAGIEEFHHHVDTASALSMIEECVGLARRAQHADERLFCWWCL